MQLRKLLPNIVTGACAAFSLCGALVATANTSVSTLSCTDLNELDGDARTLALSITYGHVATLHGLDVKIGSHSDLAFRETLFVCQNQPDLTLVSALEAIILVEEGVSEKVELTLQKDETLVTPLEMRQAQEALALNNPFALNPHRPNYILPATFSSDLDFSPYGSSEPLLSDAEVKFQLSLKSQLASNLVLGSSLEVGYTQRSFWQLYAEEAASAPFRETNYEPEIMWRFPLDLEVFGMQARHAMLAFTHQSNGQSRPISRSWNRLSAEMVLQRGRWVFSAKAQTRVDDPKFDDNPTVEDFMGRAQFGLGYKFNDNSVKLGVKSGFGGLNKAGAELNWSFPLSGKFHGHFQIYHGYGENLIDMENKNTRVGLGVALSSWL